MPVTISPPVAKRVTQWDEFSGRFEAVASVEVRARVSGFIDKLHFRDGQLVNVGDLLFTIDKRPFEIAVQSAEAEVARNKAQVDIAELQVERGAALVKSRNIHRRRVRPAQGQPRRGARPAQDRRSGGAQCRAQPRLDRRARAARRPHLRPQGRCRQPDPGRPAGRHLLATIVTLDPIRFVFDVSESDYLRYTRLFLSGAMASSRDSVNPVRIRLADETEWTRSGKVDFVDNTLSARSGTMRTRAIVENKNQLLTPGIFGRVQLFGGEYDALLIPDTAIVSDQSRKIVFTVNKDNVVQAKPVTLGPLVEGLRVVREGLAPTDNVVLDGLANPMVRPGAKVMPQKGEIKTADAKSN